ncbi:MAG: ribulose-phosphate 3-epimerase [Clostridiales bacterium]|nr:ribulose-phosphate 3-epimerase [Clostridiales bacterium]
MSKVLVSPSILSADFAQLGKDVKNLQDAGADWIHVDVMDGQFVPNISFGMPVVKAIRPYADIPFDVHLMIANPLKYIEEFAKVGADIITIHLETVEDVPAAIAAIKALNKKVGLAISPDTPVDAVLPYVKDVYMVLIMTVYPGFGGQSMIAACLDKVTAVVEKAKEENSELIVQVDGGINAKTVADALAAGANCIVAGSAVFSAEDMSAAIEGLRG